MNNLFVSTTSSYLRIKPLISFIVSPGSFIFCTISYLHYSDWFFFFLFSLASSSKREMKTCQFCLFSLDTWIYSLNYFSNQPPPPPFRVIEQLGGKQLVMNHMHHEDQLVRYNALLCVQKLMVHNWYVRFYLFFFFFFKPTLPWRGKKIYF